MRMVRKLSDDQAETNTTSLEHFDSLSLAKEEIYGLH